MMGISSNIFGIPGLENLGEPLGLLRLRKGIKGFVSQKEKAGKSGSCGSVSLMRVFNSLFVDGLALRCEKLESQSLEKAASLGRRGYIYINIIINILIYMWRKRRDAVGFYLH